MRFFRFWEGCSTQIVASGLSWLCGVVLALFQTREGGVSFMAFVWFNFVFYAALARAHQLLKNTPAGARSKMASAKSS